MERETAPFKRLIDYIKTHKTKSILMGVGVLLVLLYCLVFFIPKPVQFSYAGETCTSQLTLFPSLHKSSGSSVFTPSFDDNLKVGSLSFSARKRVLRPLASLRRAIFGQEPRLSVVYLPENSLL